jgi:hypothetical protein
MPVGHTIEPASQRNHTRIISIERARSCVLLSFLFGKGRCQLILYHNLLRLKRLVSASGRCREKQLYFISQILGFCNFLLTDIFYSSLLNKNIASEVVRE